LLCLLLLTTHHIMLPYPITICNNISYLSDIIFNDRATQCRQSASSQSWGIRGKTSLLLQLVSVNWSRLHLSSVHISIFCIVHLHNTNARLPHNELIVYGIFVCNIQLTQKSNPLRLVRIFQLVDYTIFPHLCTKFGPFILIYVRTITISVTLIPEF